jgi:sulfate transport system permease protein
VLPGFPLALGITLFWLCLIVLVPTSALVARVASGGWAAFWEAISDPRVVASYRLSFGTASAAALVNAVFGLVLAWVLVRYKFPGRSVVDALIDLPFALPTAVAGLALTELYAPNGLLGEVLEAWFGLKVAFTPVGVWVALVFVGLPFVVRTLQPVITDLAAEYEEAAACLGAERRTTFLRVIFPPLAPSLMTGTMLAFGRALGEYGSVVFIAGNLPFRTEITPLLIIIKLEQFDYLGAAAIGLVMMLTSLAILLVVNLLQLWGARRMGRAG